MFMEPSAQLRVAFCLILIGLFCNVFVKMDSNKCPNKQGR